MKIFRAVNPRRIAWISLGALRFPPHLRDLVRKRFPKSRVPCGEFVPGHHGKDRYFRPIREEMYRKMRSWIHAEAPEVFVYLCMENRLVWEQSFGEAPRDTSHLSNQLDAEVCPNITGCLKTRSILDLQFAGSAGVSPNAAYLLIFMWFMACR